MNEEIRRGEEAKRVLAEPLLQEAFQTVEAAIIARLRLVDVGATESQRDLVVTLQILGKVKQYLEQVVVTGKLAVLEDDRASWRDRLRQTVS